MSPSEYWTTPDRLRANAPSEAVRSILQPAASRLLPSADSMRVPKTPKPREPRPSAKGSVAEPRPLAPRGSVHFDDHDVTARRVLHDLGELNDEIPEIVDAGDSVEMTAQRPLFDPNDSVEMTAERSPL